MTTPLKTSEQSLLRLLREYQVAHRGEKRALLELPAVRSALIQQLSHYEQSGRNRKIKQSRLERITSLLCGPVDGWLEAGALMDECRFPLEFWNRLRADAERVGLRDNLDWTHQQARAIGLRNEILEQTAYLVPKIRRLNFHLDEQKVSDADGNGFLGLLKAIDNFSEAEGMLFEVYARVYILNQIVCYLRNDKLVKPSEALRRFYQRHDGKVEELRQALHREPTSQEVAEAMEIEVEELTGKQEMRSNTISLDMEMGDDEEMNLHDMIGQEAALPYERMENRLIVDRLHLAMQGLSHGESAVVHLRWTPAQPSPLAAPALAPDLAFAAMRRHSLQRVREALACEQSQDQTLDTRPEGHLGADLPRTKIAKVSGQAVAG